MSDQAGRQSPEPERQTARQTNDPNKQDPNKQGQAPHDAHPKEASDKQLKDLDSNPSTLKGDADAKVGKGKDNA